MKKLLLATLLALLCAGWSWDGAGAALSERDVSGPAAGVKVATETPASRSENPRPDPHPSAKGKRITIVQPDGVYVCSRTLCITIDLAKWAKLGARYERARTQMLPGDGGGGTGTCAIWQVGQTVYKSPGYMYVFQSDGSYLLVFRFGYATCGWLAQIGNYAWVAP